MPHLWHPLPGWRPLALLSACKIKCSRAYFVTSRPPPVPSEEIASALLFQTEQVAFVWPAFASLRSAARATKVATFRLAVSALV